MKPIGLIILLTTLKSIILIIIIRQKKVGIPVIGSYQSPDDQIISDNLWQTFLLSISYQHINSLTATECSESHKTFVRKLMLLSVQWLQQFLLLIQLPPCVQMTSILAYSNSVQQNNYIPPFWFFNSYNFGCLPTVWEIIGCLLLSSEAHELKISSFYLCLCQISSITYILN